MNWDIKPFEEICELITCGVAKRPNYVDDGIPFLSAKNVKNQSIVWSDYRYVSEETHKTLTKHNKPRKGDILYTRVGSYGEAAIVDKDQEFSIFVSLTLIKPKDYILNTYLVYFLNSQLGKKLAKDNVSSSGVGNLNVGRVRKFPIPVPPLPIQKQIVEKLDAVFADIDKAISATEKNIENAESLFFSHLNSFFNRENAEWSHLTLHEAANFIDYRGKTPKKTSEGVRLITAKNIKMGYIKTQPEEFISEESYQERMTRGFPKIGDIFFTTEAPLGNVAQLNINEKISPGQRIITLQPDASRLNNTFFKYILMSEIFQNEIKNNATGATVSGIKASLLKKIAIFFPSSKQEQKEIAEKLQESEKLSKKLMNLYLKKKDNYESLKSSILTQAFSDKFTKDAA